MRKQTLISSLAVVAALLLIGAPGCAKKSVQSGGDSQSSEQGMAKSSGPGTTEITGSAGAGGGGSADSGGVGSARSDSGGATAPGGVGSTSPGGVGSDFPPTALASRGQDEGSGAGGLKGLDAVKGGKSPSEERIGNGGTMVAKADTGGSAARQLEDIRREQVAATTAGLRDVFFAYDSWTIGGEGRQALMRDAEWMKANPGAQVKIEGHCDERGTLAYNLVLGEKRAKAVRNYLVELGVGANRLGVVSYGKERPFCKEHAESCYQQNRRGHLVPRTK